MAGEQMLRAIVASHATRLLHLLHVLSEHALTSPDQNERHAIGFRDLRTRLDGLLLDLFPLIDDRLGRRIRLCRETDRFRGVLHARRVMADQTIQRHGHRRRDFRQVDTLESVAGLNSQG